VVWKGTPRPRRKGEVEMTELYGVVRSIPNNYSFTKFHDTYEDAKKEAERLCVQFRDEFFVIKVIAICRLAEVRWEEAQCQTN